MLLFFAVLVIIGITESSRVAIGIFLFHLATLVVLSGFIGYYLIQNGIGTLIENWDFPVSKNGSITTAIFLGFAASMLGVSGFESSANFVEEQKRGVFPKTLRNMWIIVSVINPLMAVFALSLFTIPILQSPEYQNTLLIEMGKEVGSSWLPTAIALDAFLVLSGAVLTSFVGVSGLLERMTLDRVMPQFLLKKNARGTSHRIIILFFILCVSVLFTTKGNVTLLAGVYSISFLSVMALFAIGNMLLKIRRNKLPRPEKATWGALFIATIAVIIAMVGNIVMPPKPGLPSNKTVFLYYFIPAILFVLIMLNRTLLLKLLLRLIDAVFNPVRKFVSRIDNRIMKVIKKINSQEFVFFTKGDDIATLNKVMLYIFRNEHTKKLKIVTLYNDEVDIPSNIDEEIAFLDKEYPSINIEFIKLKGEFTPEKIEALSHKWNIPINFMFIGSPGDKFPYRVEELGGVRLII